MPSGAHRAESLSALWAHYIRRLWSVPFGDGEPFGHILRPPKGRKPNEALQLPRPLWAHNCLLSPLRGPLCFASCVAGQRATNIMRPFFLYPTSFSESPRRGERQRDALYRSESLRCLAVSLFRAPSGPSGVIYRAFQTVMWRLYWSESCGDFLASRLVPFGQSKAGAIYAQRALAVPFLRSAPKGRRRQLCAKGATLPFDSEGFQTYKVGHI